MTATVLSLDIGICLGFRAWDLGFPLRGVSASCFASGFCSCLIHQAQLPNKLGNHIFKLRLVTTEKGDVIARPPFVIVRPLFVIASEAKQSMSLKNIKKEVTKSCIIWTGMLSSLAWFLKWIN
jgi:hypothetical protein